jgi:tetraacyldisaccharide 4'-kinase
VPESAAATPGLRARIEAHLHRQWFGPATPVRRGVGACLRPLSWAVARAASRRRQAIAQARDLPRPPGAPQVVIVGNLIVGGTGKTPLLIALANALGQRGWRVGIIARGHRAAGAANAPMLLTEQSSALDAGDEPVLIARRTGCPVAVGHDRAGALRLITERTDCNLVLSDDGLQHLALRRDLELAVFDARGAGNGACLPEGPLREPLASALLMDAVVLNGDQTSAPVAHSRLFRFGVRPAAVIGLDDRHSWSFEAFTGQIGSETIDAVAGIGAPERFFSMLTSAGLRIRPHALSDHAPIDPVWLAALPARWLIMTEKDAVKCEGFDAGLQARCVALRIEAEVPAAMLDWLEVRLRG